MPVTSKVLRAGSKIHVPQLKSPSRERDTLTHRLDPFQINHNRSEVL